GAPARRAPSRGPCSRRRRSRHRPRRRLRAQAPARAVPPRRGLPPATTRAAAVRQGNGEASFVACGVLLGTPSRRPPESLRSLLPPETCPPGPRPGDCHPDPAATAVAPASLDYADARALRFWSRTLTSIPPTATTKMSVPITLICGGTAT